MDQIVEGDKRMDQTSDMLSGNDLYRTLLDNLYDGVYFVSPDRTIVYWNDAAERMTGFVKSELINKHCYDNFLMHVDDKGVNLCLRNCPLEKAILEGVTVEGEAYYHHKEGHRLPALVRVSPIHDKAGTIVGAVEIFSDNSPRVRLAEKVEELEKIALLDPLTRIGNRRYGDLSLTARLNELERYGWSFGVLFMDIDYFKKVNDFYGHDVGDRILRIVATTMINGTRSSDIVSRWGGEEFVALLPHVDAEQLKNVAEKIRLLVEKSSISVEGRNIEVTISIGATLAHKNDTADTLIKRADELMYKSKSEGRNRLSMEDSFYP
jgi:diguanylate cyclase (GGDEF)-like protein/PAS domain S-box-containing protein